MTRTSTAFAALAAAVLIGSGAAARAQDSDWQVTATPYLWALGVHGDVGVAGRTASVDSSFLDVVREADSVFGFQGHAELRRGRVGGFLDATYMSLGEDNITAGPLFLDASQKMALVEFGALYRAADLPWHTGDLEGASHLDLYAGARYTRIDSDLRFARGRSLGQTRDWVDPIVGARLVTDIGERWQLIAGGDVGGFGAGSDFTWSALGLVGYRHKIFGADATTVVGYRALGQDYESGRGFRTFRWDVTLRGPVLGLVLRF